MEQTEWVAVFAAELRRLRAHVSEQASLAVGDALWPMFREVPPRDVAARYDRASDEAAAMPGKRRAPRSGSAAVRRKDDPA